MHILVAGRAGGRQVLEAPAVDRRRRSARGAPGAPGGCGRDSWRTPTLWCCPPKNSGRRGWVKRRHAEDGRRVAGFARLAEFGLVHVGVARRAGGGQARGSRRRAAARGGAECRVLVALRAGQRRVRAGQREPRARGVVERAAPEAGLVVAAAAVLLEGAAMRVLVARGAAVELQGEPAAAASCGTSRRRRPRACRAAGTPCARDRPSGSSTCRGVARRARVAHRLPVRALVAVGALRELQALEHLVDVALRARHACGARRSAGRRPSHGRTACGHP